MDTPMDQLKTTVQGHALNHYDDVNRVMVCRHPEHSSWTNVCWKAHAATFLAEHNVDVNEAASKEDHAQAIVTLLDSGAVLNRFLFLAEGITEEGQRAMYVTTSDNLAVWDELGMLVWAEKIVDGQIRGGQAHTQ